MVAVEGRDDDRRAGRINFASLLIMAGMGFAGYWGWVFGPYYWEHHEMNRLVEESLGVWYDTGVQREGENFLRDELDERGLSDSISYKDCEFKTFGVFRHLKCTWSVVVEAPVFGRKVLHFKSYYALDESGMLMTDPTTYMGNTIANLDD